MQRPGIGFISYSNKAFSELPSTPCVPQNISVAPDMFHGLCSRPQVQQHTDDLKVNETEIAEYKKKTCDTEQRLASLHTLYEKVVAERNLYSKNLVEIQVGGMSSPCPLPLLPALCVCVCVCVF